MPAALLPGAGFETAKLLSPGEAIAAYFERVPLGPLGAERVPLAMAFGRILAERMDADADYPNAARSSMDGFALEAAATPGAFALAGEIRMGSAWDGRLAAGSALRIPTGGVVPEGADAVVPIEDARVEGGRVWVDAPVPSGDCISPQGGDMRRGEPVLPAGRRIGAPELGVLATLGVVDVPVLRRPMLAVISSGDELIEPGRAPAPGQIRDSNRYAIAGALQAMGCAVRHYPIVPDLPGALEAALREALAECDGAMLSGGSSVGERDLTPDALAALGDPGVVVHGLRVKPGKPTVLGALGRKPIVGLPGNPTSALVILEAVVAPIVAALVGAPAPKSSVDARLAGPMRSNAGWTWYLPVSLEDELGDCVAHPLPLRSSAVSLTARAAGYVIMDERAEVFEAGDRVRVHRFF